MTNELKGCPCCKGRKKLIGLGSIEIDCGTCNGIGWVKSNVSFDNPPDIEVTKEELEELFPIDDKENKAIIKEECKFPGKKKPGPKPKLKNMDIIENGYSNKEFKNR